MSKFYTIGQLKEAIKDLPDDALIYPQVTAKDGSSWYMSAAIDKTPSGLIVLTLTHTDLQTLLGA